MDKEKRESGKRKNTAQDENRRKNNFKIKRRFKIRHEDKKRIGPRHFLENKIIKKCQGIEMNKS